MKKLFLLLSVLCVFAGCSKVGILDALEFNREVDEYDGEISIRSSLSRPMHISKTINGGTVSYVIIFTAHSSSLSLADEQEVSVRFTDGTTREWNMYCDCDYDGDGSYRYMAGFIPTTEELELFATKTIEKYRIWIIETKHPRDTKGFRQAVQEIQDMW